MGGWLEKWSLKLSQLPTKLKLKLKLSLAIIITALGAGGVVCVCRPIFATLGPNLGIQLDLNSGKFFTCKLGHKVALFSTWGPPTHPPLGRNKTITIE